MIKGLQSLVVTEATNKQNVKTKIYVISPNIYCSSQNNGLSIYSFQIHKLFFALLSTFFLLFLFASLLCCILLWNPLPCVAERYLLTSKLKGTQPESLSTSKTN